MSFIHTFGRDIKYNSHIHTLVAECTSDYKGNKKTITTFRMKFYANHLRIKFAVDC